jgi:hypothetical protein
MGIALTVIGLLRMRRKHARLVVRLALSLGIFMAGSVGRRRTRTNAGQEGLEIVWGGHFCRTPWLQATSVDEPSFAKLSEALLREQKG